MSEHLPPPAFIGGTIDRSAHLRTDPDTLSRLFGHPERRLIPIWQDQHPFDAVGHPVSVADAGGRETVFLGLDNGVPWFAVDLSDHADQPAIGVEWQNLRWAGAHLPAPEAAILASARGLLYWHSRHRFCGVCGHPTESQEGGHRRQCVNPDCATPHFPRTDPAVIMLVTDRDGRALLGRQARWPAGMLSTLAGFVEPGETLEQTVVREVFEEAGIRAHNVRYAGSQPWPLPSSLMLGFEAEALTTDIKVDTDELEYAGWFTRDEVRAFVETVPEGSPGWSLPGKVSIARWLVRRWLGEAR